LKFVVAPNAFKGSLSAKAAAEAIEQGIRNYSSDFEAVRILISDGGDGFIEALQIGLSATTHQAIVTGPTGNKITASFIYSPNNQIAVIEMAVASGLALLNESEFDPMHASSVGVGQLIFAALDLGATHIVLGIGGSATNDGGTGMATALGIRFLDNEGNSLDGNAKNLSLISKIDCAQMDARLKNVSIDVACDVSNPLLGEQGAAAVYGPQKGATEEQVKKIEAGLTNLANHFKKDLNKDVKNLIGGGAAGGLGAGLYAMFNATLKPGADLLLDLSDFDKKISNADLLITTEGRLDTQTRFGKAPSVAAKRAGKFDIPAIAIAGQVENNNIDWPSLGFTQVYSLCDDNITPEFAIQNAAQLLTKKTEQAVGEFMSCHFDKSNTLTKHDKLDR